MPKCPHCGREISNLSLEVVEIVRYDEIYLDDETSQLVLSENSKRAIYDRKQYRYLCPHCFKLITYYTNDAINFLRGKPIRIPKENYFRLIV